MKVTFWDAAMASVMGMIALSTMRGKDYPILIDDEPSSRYYPEWWPHVWADRNKSGGPRGASKKVAVRPTLDGYSATLTTPHGDVRVEFTNRAYDDPYFSAQWWAEEGASRILSLCDEEMGHFVGKEAPCMGNRELAAIANS